MNYIEARTYIREIENSLGSDYSLREVSELSERMGRPDRKTKMIHIAGTNGKGSVGNFICQVLALSGYRVGRYASPAVFRYRECIQNISALDGKVTGEDISEREVAEAVTVLRKHCDDMISAGYHQPTAFEIETVMAFQKFVDWEVDVAVVECGLGGRLDATNIMEHPLQCIFTSIGMDHQRILGDSLEEIATEKYGIVVGETQVISPQSDACVDLLAGICQRRGAELHFLAEDTLKVGGYSIGGTFFSYRGKDYQVGQLGTFQAENAALAVEALVRLKEKGLDRIGEDEICQGLLTSRWPGRLDVVSRKPFVLVDGAHNASAVKRLTESLEIYFPGERFDFIFGVFRDKDYWQEMEILVPFLHRAYTVTAPGRRGLSGEDLEECIAQCAGKRGAEVEIISCDSMEQACGWALKRLERGRKLVVCGSLSIVGDACQYLGEAISHKKIKDE